MIEADRIISGQAKIDEDVIDRAIRPKLLADYVGQPQVREQMDIFIKAAKLRQDALDHLLIFGPPGLGKTTLANIVANEMGVNIRTTSGPVLEKAGDLAAILTSLEENDILFIDEIHTIVGAGKGEGSLDAGNMLKPMLARGELRVIGATTIDEYRKYIEKDSALERRFQQIVVNEPTKENLEKELFGSEQDVSYPL